MAEYDLYPLLSLNFFFRFAFAAYKSIFAFFCSSAFGYGAKEVWRARGSRTCLLCLVRALTRLYEAGDGLCGGQFSPSCASDSPAQWDANIPGVPCG